MGKSPQLTPRVSPYEVAEESGVAVGWGDVTSGDVMGNLTKSVCGQRAAAAPTARRLAALAVIAMIGLTQAGCGAAGSLSDLIDKIKNGSSTATTTAATSTATTTNSTTTPTTTTPVSTPVVANQGNAFLVRIGDVSTGAITAQSPKTGSLGGVGTPGAWSAVTDTTELSGLDSYLKSQLAANPSWKVYKRTASLKVLGGGTGVPDSSLSGVQYVALSCDPSTGGCFGGNIDFNSSVAKQNGVIVAEKTVVPGLLRVTLKEQQASQDNYLIGNSKIVDPAWHGLQYSSIGNATDADLNFLVTSVGGVNGPGLADIKGSVTTGFGFGGTATDPAKLPKGVVATYNGYFKGLAGTTSAVTNLNGNNAVTGNNLIDVAGNTQINADFGAGQVSGNVYNLQKASDATAMLPYGLKMTGTITGSTYAGTTAFTGQSLTPGANANSTGNKGDLLGGFFGINGEETAGIVRIQDTAAGTATNTANTLVIGGFGAVKAAK